MPRDISNCKNIKKVMSLQKLLPSNGEKKHYNTKMSSHEHLRFNKYLFKTPASVVQMPQIQYTEYIVQFNPHNKQHSLT